MRLPFLFPPYLSHSTDFFFNFIYLYNLAFASCWAAIIWFNRYDGLHHGSSYLEHLNFLYAVRAKGVEAPPVDLEDGLISVAMGVAAQLSIEKGRFVTIEEVMGETKWWSFACFLMLAIVVVFLHVYSVRLM